MILWMVAALAGGEVTVACPFEVGDSHTWAVTTREERDGPEGSETMAFGWNVDVTVVSREEGVTVFDAIEGDWEFGTTPPWRQALLKGTRDSTVATRLRVDHRAGTFEILNLDALREDRGRHFDALTDQISAQSGEEVAARVRQLRAPMMSAETFTRAVQLRTWPLLWSTCGTFEPESQSMRAEPAGHDAIPVRVTTRAKKKGKRAELYQHHVYDPVASGRVMAQMLGVEPAPGEEPRIDGSIAYTAEVHRRRGWATSAMATQLLSAPGVEKREVTVFLLTE